jgi:multidrug resistance efflux pump
MKFRKTNRKKTSQILMPIGAVVIAILMTACSGGAAGDTEQMPGFTSAYSAPNDAAYSEEAVQSENAASLQLDTISAIGTVESALRRNVYTTLGFFVGAVYVEVGDEVTKGQVLAVLDNENLELAIRQANAQMEAARVGAGVAIAGSQNMLNSAAANVRNNSNLHVVSAQAALAAAEANITAIQTSLDAVSEDSEDGSNMMIIAAQSALTAAKLALENSETNYEDARLMYDVGGISQFELRLAQDTLTMARTGFGDAQANLNNAKTSQDRTIEQLQISLDSAQTARTQAQNALSAAQNAANQEVDMLRSNLAAAQAGANFEAHEIAIAIMERQLEDSIITSPISGTVTAVIAAEGMIGAGLMFVIEDTDNLRIMTRFREYDMGKLREGMEVTISTDVTGGETYEGLISRINPAAVPNMGMPGSIVEFEAEITVSSESTNLRIGMNTRLNVHLANGSAES